MIASDLRFAIKKDGWYVVDIATGHDAAGPVTSAFDAIDARQKLAQVDVNAVVDGRRRRAREYTRELEAVR